jgi:hypothetical protein
MLTTPTGIWSLNAGPNLLAYHADTVMAFFQQRSWRAQLLASVWFECSCWGKLQSTHFLQITDPYPVLRYLSTLFSQKQREYHLSEWISYSGVLIQ